MGLIFNLNINYIIILMTNFDEIKELLTRWERHKNFLKIIKESNINHVHDEWKEQIDNTFRSKIKSKL
jgi:uncharacterized protein YlbG (UPF0298 family)